MLPFAIDMLPYLVPCCPSNIQKAHANYCLFTFVILFCEAMTLLIVVNPCPAELIYLNFHPLEVVSGNHDPQPQVV